MVRIPESRKARRLRARLDALGLAMTPELPVHLRQGRPRYGVRTWVEPPEKSEREKMIEKFGESANTRDTDRRQGDRRVRGMTPKEVEEWMKFNGMLGGDRRKAERRQGDRRK